MSEFEIVVNQTAAGVKRCVASAVVQENGTLLERLRTGRVITTTIMPLGDGESVWGVIEQVCEMLSDLEEIGG